MAIKGDALDWMSDAELREQLFEAEAQEIAAGVLGGKIIKKEIRDDKKMMLAITRELAKHLVGDTADDR
jgi:hypothetical protein